MTPSVIAEIDVNHAAATGQASQPALGTTLRRVVPKVAAGVLDQGLTSGANAAVSFVMAAWLNAADYGIFSLGYTIFLIAAGFHNSLILEPVSVLGASRFVKNVRAYLKQVFVSQLLISVLAAFALIGIAWLVPMSAGARIASLGAALLCPPLLTVWYFRRIQYLVGTPHKAAWIATVYAAALVILLVVAKFHRHVSSLTGLGLMAAAALIACGPSLLHIRQAEAEPSFATVVRAHWGFGKWFVAAPLLAVGTNHIQILVVASCLGMAGTGALRATMNFAMPLVQLVTALSNLALPSLAQTYTENPGKFRAAATRLVITYGAGGFAYMLAISLFGGRLERLVYGSKFNAGAGTFFVLGIWILAVCISNASGMALRAQQSPKACLLALIASSAFGFITAKPLILAYGVCGAAISMAGTYVASAAVQLVALHRIGGPSGNRSWGVRDLVGTSATVAKI